MVEQLLLFTDTISLDHLLLIMLCKSVKLLALFKTLQTKELSVELNQEFQKVRMLKI